MELSPRQRVSVFAVIVLLLAALGYYLVLPLVNHHGSAQAATPQTALHRNTFLKSTGSGNPSKQ